jgi:hypothetical protein
MAFYFDRTSYDENFSYIRSFHASPRMNLLSRGVDEREYLPWMSDLDNFPARSN